MNRGQTPKAIARNLKETQDKAPRNFALARAWLEAKRKKENAGKP